MSIITAEIIIGTAWIIIRPAKNNYKQISINHAIDKYKHCYIQAVWK